MNHETGPAVRTITFSRNVFLPVTNVCRNKCAYCSFRRNSSDPDAHLMTADEVRRILETGVLTGCTEALFTFGEYADADPVISKKLSEYGYASMTDYVLNLSKTAIGLCIL
ncbi:7,8-didemethyl-8-hydroxy-5-deazariboflavin synthase subunit CofG, partial [Methanosarcinaceae archaeon]|nr:7,8-didemethyl-8-hydroxy-5-deazariboflavin synthase subunit CofG [Methanosarcinaceae archaeon]